jgi:hypothetical protein
VASGRRRRHDMRKTVLRWHLNDRLHVCTMASDHCGLLTTPRAVPA